MSKDIKFILGTAQLGKKYGRYSDNKIDNEECNNIMKFCSKNNINTFDTAQNYGNAESILSNYNNINIITKININNNIVDSVQKSLDNLKTDKIDILLLHDFDDFKNDKIVNELIELKTNGIINKLGVSIYTVHEALYIFNSKYNDHFEIIQLPINILDNQWDNIEFLYYATNKIIYTRSIFLQGIILNEYNTWPVQNELSLNIYNKIEECCTINNITKIELCFNYIKTLSWVNGIVIGIDNTNQLIHNFNIFNKPNKNINFSLIKNNKIPEKLIDPRKWN